MKTGFVMAFFCKIKGIKKQGGLLFLINQNRYQLQEAYHSSSVF